MAATTLACKTRNRQGNLGPSVDPAVWQQNGWDKNRSIWRVGCLGWTRVGRSYWDPGVVCEIPIILKYPKFFGPDRKKWHRHVAGLDSLPDGWHHGPVCSCPISPTITWKNSHGGFDFRQRCLPLHGFCSYKLVLPVFYSFRSAFLLHLWPNTPIRS